MGNNVEELLACASRKRVVHYNRVNGETITFQIGRVVYSMSRQRAGVFLRDALAFHGPVFTEEQTVAETMSSHVGGEMHASGRLKEER